MRLFLLRHGESLHSQRGIIASAAACPGLTEGGHGQAVRLGQRLQRGGMLDEGVVLLCSPALRAQGIWELARYNDGAQV
jgi:broad specificity phosphatase PhoE